MRAADYTRYALRGSTFAALMLAAFVIAVASASSAAATQEASRETTAIVGATVLPMTGEGALPDRTILIEDDRIVAIAPRALVELPVEARVVEASGAWVVPGLVDAHVHIFDEAELPLYVQAGITTVRNLWGWELHTGLRARIADGELVGPRIYTSGPLVDGDPPTLRGSAVPATAEEARLEVEDQIRQGFDGIKIYDGLTPEIYGALVAEARRHRVPVWGHVPAAVGLELAIAAGQRSVEHFRGFPDLGVADELDVPSLRRIAASMRQAGTAFVPTLAVLARGEMSAAEQEAFLENPRLESLPDFYRRFCCGSTDEPEDDLDPAVREARSALRHAIVRELHDAGVRVLPGSDTGNRFVLPGESLHAEFAELVAAGLSPEEALVAATRSAAEFLGGASEFGTIEPGKRADLIVVDGDPRQEISALKDPRAVVVGGRLLVGSDLDGRITALKRRVFEGLAHEVEIEGEEAARMALADRMEHYRTPGIAVAVIEDGELAWTHEAGVLEAGQPGVVEPDTRFMGKSLAKPVTAMATLRLVAEGTLDLDAPIDRYLDRWHVPDNEHTRAAEPTLRQVLSHRAGFTVWGVPSYAPGETLPSLVEALLGRPPAEPPAVTVDYEPGTRSRYSGGGYSVLQLALEDVTGRPFEELMEDLVLEPTEMTDSFFASDIPASVRPVMARGHGPDGSPYPGGWERLVQLAAGGLVTTAGDMARFVIAVSEDWNGRGRLVSRPLMREALTADESGRGLGFEVRGEDETIHFLHTGSGDGFRAFFVGFPALGKGAVVLASGDEATELRYEVVRSLARELDWPAFGVVRRSMVELPVDRLEAFAGTYEFSDGSEIGFELRDGALFASWAGKTPVRLYAESPARFFNRTDETYVFEREEDGFVAAVSWSGEFGSFLAERSR